MFQKENTNIVVSSNKWNSSTHLIFRLIVPRYLRNFYKNYRDLELIPFLNKFFKKVHCNYHVSDNLIHKIPENQGFITVSNHPTGILEGALLLYIIRQKRPDYKVAGLPIFRLIKPFFNALIPLSSLKSINKTNYRGIKQSINHLKKGNSVGFFPEAQIVPKVKLNDLYWDNPSIKLIKKMNLPIIPIYFDIKANRLINFLGKLNKVLLLLFLPRILFLKKRNITMVAGNLISIEAQNEIPLIDFSNYLQSKIYGLKK